MRREAQHACCTDAPSLTRTASCCPSDPSGLSSTLIPTTALSRWRPSTWREINFKVRWFQGTVGDGCIRGECVGR